MSDLEYKKCKTCQQIKKKTLFYKAPSNNNKLRASCKDCEKLYQTKYQLEHRNSVLARMAKNRTAKKQKAVELKGNQCQDCKQIFPLCVYDFHHLDGANKEHSLNTLWQKAWTKILQELDKCILLCSNCHRQRHYSGEI